MRSDAAPDREPAGDGTATAALPDLDPRSTRQQWSRSALAAPGAELSAAGSADAAAAAPAFAAGTGHGVVRAFDPAAAEQWTADLGGMVVRLEPAVVDGDPVLLAGTRGETAVLTLLDASDGRVRWTHDLEADLGSATRETLFYYPMAVALATDATAPATDGKRLYAAARRYEREGDDRLFESRVYAFDPDGTLVWTRASDASPIALGRRDERLAVAYNRCHGDHQCGLVVRDAADGEVRSTWDPGTEGGRRVGDVTLDAGGALVASHGDYRGYALDRRGRTRWRVDLGRPETGETDVVYTYPNRVGRGPGGQVYFVTGNTFPEEGRDTDDRHPREHSLAAAAEGEIAWTTPIDGWLGGIETGRTAAAADGRIAVATGQHFRDRTPESHGVRLIDTGSGAATVRPLEGIGTALAVGEEAVAVLEEPISYHDEDRTRGTHRLLVVDDR